MWQKSVPWNAKRIANQGLCLFLAEKNGAGIKYEDEFKRVLQKPSFYNGEEKTEWKGKKEVKKKSFI